MLIFKTVLLEQNNMYVTQILLYVHSIIEFRILK
jgi:hypothetical protein